MLNKIAWAVFVISAVGFFVVIIRSGWQPAIYWAVVAVVSFAVAYVTQGDRKP